jgi:hypothetical protein
MNPTSPTPYTFKAGRTIITDMAIPLINMPREYNLAMGIILSK